MKKLLFSMLACRRLLLLGSFFILVACAGSPAVSTRKLDRVVENTLSVFNTPGMAVAVVHKGQVVHLQGYGQRQLEEGLAVTPDTYFRLASASKAFTAASVAVLVDEGKLSWDDKVIDHLPEFRLQDAWVTAEFTIRDLLSHRSGLVGGAGDSMLWPEPTGFSRTEVIHNLRYLTPEHGFRSSYGYSNVFYITAGELVAKVSGRPWQDFVAERIFTPLGMNCFAGDIPGPSLADSAVPYGYDPQQGFYPVTRNAIGFEGLMSAAAGGIVCSAADMAKWLQALLAISAENPTASTLPFSAAQLKTMWAPETLMPVSQREQQWDQTHFSAYGLGWRMADMHGYKVVHHTGTLSGFQAHVVLVPELELGVVLLNNGSDSNARTAVMQTILKSYMPQAEQRDWVSFLQQERLEREQRMAASGQLTVPVGNGEMLLPLTAYGGIFRDVWFGQMIVSESADGLRIQSEKMPTLSGRLEPFAGHSFVIRWDNPAAQRAALITFTVDTRQQVSGFTLLPFTLNVRPGHEYRDMIFERVAVL